MAGSMNLISHRLTEDSNPGWVGGKHLCHLCAMPPNTPSFYGGEYPDPCLRELRSMQPCKLPSDWTLCMPLGLFGRSLFKTPSNRNSNHKKYLMTSLKNIPFTLSYFLLKIWIVRISNISLAIAFTNQQTFQLHKISCMLCKITHLALNEYHFTALV